MLDVLRAFFVSKWLNARLPCFMKKSLLFLVSLVALLSCASKEQSLISGPWRITLDIGDAQELPIQGTVVNGVLTIQNAEERITIDEISIHGDSITIQPPVYEGIFKGVFSNEGKSITGDFIKSSLDRVVPFEMVYGEDIRFRESVPASQNISGAYETVFSPETPADRYIAKGIFNQNGNQVTGTFRTTTGDYRYLEGAMIGDSLKLSAFDGAHAFLFEAKVTDSTLNGIFYSGNHFKEPFIARLNNSYELPDAKDLTFLKEGYDSFDFEFPEVSGKLVSLGDDRFKEKVVIVQIMGTWCPNCLDETKFYKEYLKKNPDAPVTVVGLAFEYAPNKAKAFNSIQRLKDRLDITYPILLAQYGTSDKLEAAKKLPMLNHILSYPTSIFIDKKGTVRRIHTGYNGPATGDKHLEFKEDFEAFVAQLIGE